jgi:NitT/TauT family transport system permease protein
MHKKKNLSFLFSLLAFAILIGVWWIIAETRFKQSGVIPNPIETFKIIGGEMQKASFFKAIFSTLQRSLVSFLISFSIACVFAAFASRQKFIGKMLNPFIALCRSMPTIALVLILLITVGSNLLPAMVAFLVVFPLCYENMLAAIAEVPQNLIKMADVFKMPKYRQIASIYVPSMLPYVFSSIIAGFGLNIKVVISAEVMGLPMMSVGFLILSAKQGFEWGIAFAWLVIAVLLSLICEAVLKAIRRLCMPYKYPDVKIIKGIIERVFKRGVKQ